MNLQRHFYLQYCYLNIPGTCGHVHVKRDGRLTYRRTQFMGKVKTIHDEDNNNRNDNKTQFVRDLEVRMSLNKVIRVLWKVKLSVV